MSDRADVRAALTTRREDVLRAAGPPRSRGRVRRWLITSMIAAALLGAAAVAYRRSNEEKPPAYISKPVLKGDLVEAVTAVGTLAAVDAVDVGAEVTGRLTRVLVDVNDEVQTGQILAEIDPEQLEARVRENRAQLSQAVANQVSAKASLSEAEQRAQRIAALHREGVATADEHATAQAALQRAAANVEVAGAQIAVARAGLATAESQLARARIRAPISGIVLARAVEPGQTVTAGFQTPVLFTLARDLSELELQVEVDEADIGKVREGQPASFVVDAHPGRRFASKVLKLHNLPKTGATIVTYAAVLSVDNRDRSLRPGMTATADIVTDELEGVLLVDNAALRFELPRPQGGRGPGGFLPVPGFGGPMGQRRPPNAQGGPGPGRGESDASGKAGNGERVFVMDGAKPRRVDVEVLGTDGTRSAISARNPDVALEPGTPVIIDIGVGAGS